MKPLVVVTRNIPRISLDLLKPHFKIDYYERDRAIPRKDLLKRVKNADGVLCLLTEKIDAEFFDAAPKCRIVATFSVGLDHVDLPEATRRGVLVTHTPGVLTETCADFTFALLLSSARRIVEGDRMMRADKYPGWDPLMLLGTDVFGKTIGVIGFGRIGQAVARRAVGFGMKTLYADVQPVFPEIERSLNARRVEMDELFRDSDFVCVHTVLDASTKHLVNEARLKSMKRSAYLINAARGPIVDEKALVKALKQGWIRGAALDVYEREPKTEPGLTKLPNVVLAPHLASASLETREGMGNLAAASLVEFLILGGPPKNLANKDVIPKGRSATLSVGA
ncbi:MAG: D-glycerate dehydrogenase [Elusimicrobia bacterium]|nr:D-glycerate dehydrogenase [Elusimicrobiota bacterium]